MSKNNLDDLFSSFNSFGNKEDSEGKKEHIEKKSEIQSNNNEIENKKQKNESVNDIFETNNEKIVEESNKENISSKYTSQHGEDYLRDLLIGSNSSNESIPPENKSPVYPLESGGSFESKNNAKKERKQSTIDLIESVRSGGTFDENDDDVSSEAQKFSNPFHRKSQKEVEMIDDSTNEDDSEFYFFDGEKSDHLMTEKLKGYQGKTESSDKISSKIEEVEYSYTGEDSEQELAFDAEFEEKKIRMERKQKRKAFLGKLFSTIMAIACLYIVFLIYGLLNTQYVYNDKGEVVPEIVTSDSLIEKRDFEQVATIYLGARELYQDVLLIDYQLGNQSKDFVVIATDYNEVLGRIDKQLLDLSTIDVMPNYAPLKDNILSFLANDLAVYLQNISGAITNNDPIKQDHAIQDKERCYQNFLHITGNMIEVGNSINGFDVSEFANWSPEQYIESEVYGY